MKQFYSPLLAGLFILLLCSGTYNSQRLAGDKIKVISDPEKVSRIKAEISARIEALRQEKLRKRTLPEKYKSGDKTVVPEIISILKGNDADAKRIIYNGLGWDFESPGDYTIREPELAEVIFANLYRPEDEGGAMQLAGITKLPGYQKKFEDFLFSGKASDTNRLIYWLSQEGSSIKTLELLKKKILEKDHILIALDDLLYSLQGFAKSRDKAIRVMSVSIALEIYNRKMIPTEKFEELRNSWASDNPASDLLTILFNYGDERVLPIAHNMLHRDIESYQALNAIARLEGIRQKNLLFKYLSDMEQFYNMLPAAATMYNVSKDESIPKEILKQYGNEKEYAFRKAGWVVDALIQMNATTYLAEPEKFIPDPKTAALMKEYYMLAQGSPASMAEDLYKMGVVDQPIDKIRIDKANRILAEDESENATAYTYVLLNASGIYACVFTEAWEHPLAYDKMTEQLLMNSNGKLANTLIWVEVIPRSKDRYKYKITLVTSDKAYEIEPEEKDGLYDLQSVLDLLNRSLADSGLKERFNIIPTGNEMVEIVFGPDEPVKAFLKKYHWWVD